MNKILKPNKFIFIFLFALFFSQAQSEYLPVASYKVDIRLDDKEKKISGQERIYFLNTSNKDIDTLYLHLNLNALSSDSTIFIKESEDLKKLMEKEEYKGYLKIKKINSHLEELGYKMNETIMQIFLSRPLKPGENIEFELEFELKLPKIVLESGYDKDNYIMRDWLPKMAVLEKDGTWSAPPQHLLTEHYSDFGTYDVTITLPLKYIIEGTGYVISEKRNTDSTKTVTFHAEKVHDFSFCASPDFKIRKANIEGVEVIFLILPEDLYKFQRWLKATELTLSYCNSHFGKYPYAKLVIADISIGMGAGAMECPMMITVTPKIPFLLKYLKLDESIIIHELVHQWWYGIVANNETEEAWLDEGFTTYTTRKIMEEKFGEKGNILNRWGVVLSDQDIARLAYLTAPKLDLVVTPAWKSVNIYSYSTNVYYTASLVLDLLENTIGKEKMDKLLKEYYDRYQFKHPKTEDFIKISEEIAGQKLDGFFGDWLYSAKTCDYEVRKIKSEELGSSKNKKEKLYETTVELRRNGDIIIPVDIQIELENGEKIRKSWDGEAKWFKLKLETKAKIKSATLGPKYVNILDVNINNNALSTNPYRWPVFKFFSDYLFWMESAIQWMMDLF
ncbi:MAG: M1 family metallopeptidase [candidate division Zixibacteria bacterium]|nr:M1 family metallopeptidase [candidate division Zixibacteria bacterium]